METKVCRICKKEKSVLLFHADKRRKCGLGKCEDCEKEFQKKQYKKEKKQIFVRIARSRKIKYAFIKKYKEKYNCKNCGENRHYVLDFHHRDESLKLFNVSSANTASLNRIKEEIKKCDVLCSNCHREEHFLRRPDSNQ